MTKYNERGLKVTTLWDLHRRVVSSFDKLTARGGLEKGRVDIHPFHTNAKIRPVKYTVWWDDLTTLTASFDNPDELEAMWTALGVPTTGPTPRQDGFIFEIDTLKEDPAAIKKGLIRIELEFVDMDNWIQVYSYPSGSSSSDQFKIDPDRDFEICIVYNSAMSFATQLVRLSVPLPLSDHRNTSFFIGSSQYRLDFISSGNTTEAMLTKVQGMNFEYVFIRYVNY